MEIFLILLCVGYLIYKITFKMPKDIIRSEEKIDMLKLELQEIKIKLNEINKKLDNN